MVWSLRSLTEIVVASKDCTAQVYDVASGRCEQIYEGHFGWVLTAAQRKWNQPSHFRF